MANYTKSFNFRNGVQVDDSNFIVNSVGLVGIGTTIPEKHLDVRGNAKIVGDARITGFTSVTNIEVVGVMTVGAGITLDPASGIITATKFVGDASGLTNIVAIATGGFIANVGSLTTTAKVGIGSLTPTSLLDVLGDSKFVGVTTFTGITTSSDTLFANSLSVKTLSVEGISTFIGLVTAKGGAYIDNLQIGISDDNEIDTSSGNLTLDSATGQTIVDDNLNVTGIASAADYKGLNDTAADFPNGFTVTTGTFSTKLNTGVGATVGFGTTAYFPDNAAVVFGDDEDLILSHDGEQSILSEQGTGGFKILTSTFRVRNSGNDKQFIVANTGNVKLYQDGNEKFETISTGASVYNQLNVASFDGGASGLSPHFGALRYGNEDAVTSPYSTRTSLDLINTDSGNINFYLNSNNLSSTGDFFWHKGFNNSRLMTLTGDTGRLGVGIGNTLPENTLHVLGSAKITSTATFGENVDIAGNLTVTGSLNSNITGNVTGHIISAGISTFSDGLLVTGVTTSTSFKSNNIGVNANVGSNPVEINSGDNLVFVSAAGHLGIRTDETFGNSLLNTGASISNVVGVGTTLPTAAVDFAAAGKNLGGTSLANKGYMYPPIVNNSEEAALTGMQDGAIIYNKESNELKVYITDGGTGAFRPITTSVT